MANITDITDVTFNWSGFSEITNVTSFNWSGFPDITKAVRILSAPDIQSFNDLDMSTGDGHNNPLASTANTGLLTMNLNEMNIPDADVGLSMDTTFVNDDDPNISIMTEYSAYSLEPYFEPELIDINLSTDMSMPSYETDHLNAMEGAEMSVEDFKRAIRTNNQVEQWNGHI